MNKHVNLAWFAVATMAVSAAAQTTLTSSGTTATVGNVPYVSASTSTSTTLGISPISVSTSSGNVGIGTPPQIYTLDVNGANDVIPEFVTATSTVQNGLSYAGWFTLANTATAGSTSAARYALLGLYSKTGGGDDAGYQAGAGMFQSNITAGTTATLRNVDSKMEIGNGATVTTAIDFYADGNAYSGGIVGTRKGVAVQDFLQPVSTQIGLYAGPLYSGTVNNYGVYVDGTEASYFGGNVGIGNGLTAPGKPLDVLGTIRTSANAATHDTGGIIYPDGSQQTTAWTGVLCGGDYAEAVDPEGGLKAYGPGDVLVISDDTSADVLKSSQPYSTNVAGIFATKPGVIGRREALPKDAENLPMAMVGIVPTKVIAENGPIHRGDLLVTSSTAGYAMKGTDRSRMLGAVIGKAMGSLDKGDGVIEVLVTLQ